MRIPLAVLLLPLAVALEAQTPVPRPTRDVTDPGVIATGQRITPAGMQSVFNGKVGGVRFGRTSDEIWVAVPASVYRIAWRNNDVLARGVSGSVAGVHAITIDTLRQRALASYGRGARAKNVTQLAGFDLGLTGDSAAGTVTSRDLGDYMAGAPAVSNRFALLPLPANDALAVLDAPTLALIKTVPLGVEPIAAVISRDSRVAYVSVLGGARPTKGDWASAQCCDARSEGVRVDAHGIAAPGNVSRVDLATDSVTTIGVGLHPTALVWNESRARLYVALGNSDSIAVVDTRSNTVTERIAIAPFRERKIGLAPTALALAPDGATLYVTLGGVNALAVYDVRQSPAQLRGLVPTSWYPSSVDASRDGRYLAVGSLFGPGSGSAILHGKTGRYVFAVRGAVNVIPAPTASELAAYSTAVAQNNKLTLANSVAPVLAARPTPAPRAVPERPGDPSLIDHVVFIIKENRTYDQVLGDHERGAHDTSLVMYGRAVTPNTHALASEFVTLDHFFASGGNSADGHQWLTQANETDYPMWPLYYGRSYPSEGIDPLAYSAGGFLWQAAESKGKSVTVFGEYAPAPRTSFDTVRARMLAQYADHPADFAFQRALLTGRFNTHSDIPSLDKLLVREYPGWTQEVPDVVKAGDILSHLGEWEREAAMPNLVMIVLPNDHTEGTSPGWCAPRACVADNDYALGKIVEGLSRSSFWKSMAILVVEDDAQDGVDHIDGHRTVALAISPFARRRVVVSTVYSQPSMVKTVELMLGLPAMSLFDLVASDMRASFIDAGAAPDLRPYVAVVPSQSLTERNPAARSIRGDHAADRRRAALASARMPFRDPDEAPSDVLNRILWHDARGWGVPYPAARGEQAHPH